MNETDLSLLGRYARQGDEDAFGEIVRRHPNLVASAALRAARGVPLAALNPTGRGDVPSFL